MRDVHPLQRKLMSKSLLLVVAIAISAPAAAAAQTTSVATLAELAFMSGCWRGEFDNGAALEEIYTTPSANLMLGLSRFMRGDRAVQFEFARITADSTGVVLLPFPNGRPSEHPFRMTRVESGRAVFEAPEHDFPKRIIYSRAGDDALSARIDGGTDASQSQQWTMQRTTCPR